MTKNRRKRFPARPGAARPAVGSSARRNPLLWLGAILVLTFVVYIPTLDNGFTNWDDDHYVTKNPLLVHPDLRAVLTTPIVGNYHPLTVWSFVLNYRLSGLNPVSYRWLTLMLHLANTALVFWFIWELSGGRAWTAVVTSLFFGIHPMHVESVAWMAERKDVLYSFFYLIGLITYLRYLQGRQRSWLGLTLLAFVLSAASKPAAVVFPLTLLAIDYFRRRSFTLPVLLEKVPFLAVSLAAGILTLQAQQSAGATGYAHLWSPFEKVLFASYGTLMYVLKLFVPVGLSAIYPYPTSGEEGLGPKFYVALAAIVVLLSGVAYLCRRNRVVLFGVAFFFINIVLVLQFFTVGHAIMADRYTYLPYIGLFLALAWGLDERPQASPRGSLVNRLLAAWFLLLVPLSLFQTWRRCDVWQSDETLWTDAIKKEPRAALAWNNLGGIRMVKGDLPGALSDFSRAVQLNPRFWDAHANRGLAHLKLREYEPSVADGRRAIELQPQNPDNYRVYASIGEALQQMGRNDSAFVYFTRAVELKPDYAEALNDRGAIKVWRGDLAGAVSDFSRAIASNPGYRDGYANRAVAYFRMQEYEKSIGDRRRAIELDPNNGNNGAQFLSIGDALQQMKQYREAIGAYDEAIRAVPADAPSLGAYYLRRSSAWLALGDRLKALGDAREAQRRGAKVDPAFMRRLGGEP